jgi:hypothetical protein
MRLGKILLKFHVIPQSYNLELISIASVEVGNSLWSNLFWSKYVLYGEIENHKSFLDNCKIEK